MPVAEKAKLRKRARDLGIAGWGELLSTELARLVKAAEGAGNGTEETVTTTKRPPKSKRKQSMSESLAEANAYAEKMKASKTKKKGNVTKKKTKTAVTKKKVAAKTVKTKGSSHNPFRPGSNLWRITEELLRGGVRKDMVKRLKSHIELHPWSQKPADIDVDAALDKRILLTSITLRDKFDYKIKREGRGIEGTIKVVPNSHKKTTATKKVKKKVKAKR